MNIATIPPARRPELLLTPLGHNGQYVVKDPRTSEFYELGEQEHFLLERLDGKQTAETICAAFGERFGEPLSAEELEEFLELARERGFLEETERQSERETESDGDGEKAPRGDRAAGNRSVTASLHPSVAPSLRPKQSLLYWRKSLFDPDQFFSWLEPKLRFLWTRTFLVLSAGCILTGIVLVWANRLELVSYFAYALRWETVALVWLTLMAVTTCHEFAHGLTCKRYGGEVHEVGFLLLFLMPCFYCNVSDAWLFREKSKRLWVTLAGGYFELFLWAVAVLAWRLTLQDSLLNYLAWVVLSVTGVRWFFNFNPLLKLDGYYLLSDFAEVPNLRQRAIGYLTAQLRWLLWGGSRPDREPRGKFLLGFGIASWLFSLGFLTLILVAFIRFLGTRWGLAGFGAGLLLGVVMMRGLFGGLSNGEVTKMILRRRKRTTGWVMALGALPAMLFLIQIDDRAGGSFQVRPVTRAELRAPVAAFLKEVHFDEGDRVSPGALVARLDVPDLPSRMAQKHGEISQIEAKLRQLRNWEAGSHRAQLGEIPPTPDTLNAQLVRLKEELQYLEQIQQKLLVDSPVAGLITTPHLKEKVGHYFREGDLICEVEEPSALEAEIALPEQEVARVEPGQRVELKARALPFQTFKAKVNRVAPSAVPGEVQSTVTIYCRLEATSADLRPGMTGYARIYTGRRPIGWILADRVLRFLRTEFWW